MDFGDSYQLMADDPQLADDDRFMEHFTELVGKLEAKLHKAIMRKGGVKGDRAVQRMQQQLNEVRARGEMGGGRGKGHCRQQW